MGKKSEVIQVYNPKTKRWVKIDKKTGKIVAHKKSPGPYKNIPKYQPKKKKKSRKG